jgi:phosphatidylglycerol:prolipoprotein diacylglycerol transferase
MNPILVRFGPTAFIYSGHFMLFLGTLAAVFVLSREMKRTGERPDEIYGLLLLLFLSAIAGSRLLYCIDFNEQYQYNLVKALQFWKGGMALHGGALFGLVTFILYISWRKLEFWKIADLFTPPAALFVTFARAGCILMGCCYGKQCDPDFPLAMTFTSPFSVAPKDVSLYPTQPLFTLAALLVFLVVLGLRKRRRPDGETALIGVSLFSLLAFLIEFLRSDLRVLYEVGRITLSQNQVIGALVFLAVTALYFYRKGPTGRSSVSDRIG